MCLKTALRWIRADKDTKHLIVGHSSNPRTQRTLDHRSLHISLKTMIKKDLDNGLMISAYLTVKDTLLYLVLSSGGTRSIRYVSYNTRDRTNEVQSEKTPWLPVLVLKTRLTATVAACELHRALHDQLTSGTEVFAVNITLKGPR